MCHLLDPHDGVIKLRVYGLQVFERRLLVQHLLVERQREARVDELPVIQSLRERMCHILTDSDECNVGFAEA